MPKRTSRRVSKKGSKQRTRRSLKQSSKRRDKFSVYLQKKIKANIKEYKNGRWVSPQQAIAVSYSQARKKYPRSAGARKSLEYLRKRRKSKK